MNSYVIQAVERLCELLYLHAPGPSGKDVLLLLLLRYGTYNYGLPVQGRYFVAGCRSRKKSTSPQLEMAKRFLRGSKVEKHALDKALVGAVAIRALRALGGAGPWTRHVLSDPLHR